MPGYSAVCKAAAKNKHLSHLLVKRSMRKFVAILCSAIVLALLVKRIYNESDMRISVLAFMFLLVFIVYILSILLDTFFPRSLLFKKLTAYLKKYSSAIDYLVFIVIGVIFELIFSVKSFDNIVFEYMRLCFLFIVFVVILYFIFCLIKKIVSRDN
ncbi:hypothetical protein DesfrDRAFT_3543 [Solidesulfovibrio fructosivorans JJ]]|uniref:Uncharacterized protein n=1 Tax=Solidesulfovibrio fructosivorans JJ] TaxID=596151 RepID=E1K0Z3_SOLFR|nr:hypothetical protein DesfrDRAFT_3543 [Solidesulfovibrio fructosivorans JJ]]